MSGLKAARLSALIVGASRSILARDGSACTIKSCDNRGRGRSVVGNLASSGCMLSVCFVLCVRFSFMHEEVYLIKVKARQTKAGQRKKVIERKGEVCFIL